MIYARYINSPTKTLRILHSPFIKRCLLAYSTTWRISLLEFGFHLSFRAVTNLSGDPFISKPENTCEFLKKFHLNMCGKLEALVESSNLWALVALTHKNDIYKAAFWLEKHTRQHFACGKDLANEAEQWQRGRGNVVKVPSWMLKPAWRLTTGVSQIRPRT